MKYWATLIAGIIGVLLLAVVAQGAEQTVTLEWDANTEPDVVGYNIYTSQSADGPWAKVNTEGAVIETTYVVYYADGVLESDMHNRVTATDGRNESAPSNVVVSRIDTIAPASPGMLRINVEGSVQLFVNGPVTIRN